MLRVAPAPLARHLLRARDLADSRYAEPLDLASLARAARVSPRHFSRSFRRTFGETPYQYLLTRRLERARHLLRTSELRVSEICFAVGFTSVGSFTTTFRRHVGLSPTAYRRANGRPSAADRIPLCFVMAWARLRERARFEKTPGAPPTSVRPTVRPKERNKRCSKRYRTWASGCATRTRRRRSTRRSSASRCAKTQCSRRWAATAGSPSAYRANPS